MGSSVKTYSESVKIYNMFCQRGINQNAHREWEKYRSELTEFIVKNTRKNTSVAVYGAGECNDIDIYRLCDHFSSVILVDISESAVKKGMEKYGVTNNPKVKYVQLDLLGIEDNEFIEFIEKMMMKGSIEERLVQMVSLVNAAYEDNNTYEIDTGLIVTDYAIMAGLHSQINNRFVELMDLYCKTLNEMNVSLDVVAVTQMYSGVIRNAVMSKTKFAIHRLNKAVLKMTKKGIIISYEKEDVKRRGLSISGAKQCEDDIDEMCENRYISVVCEKELFWPLDASRELAYKMRLLYAKKHSRCYFKNVITNLLLRGKR